MLSFTDIYGPPQYSVMANAALPGHSNASGDNGLSAPVVDMADLHRRVERLLVSRENNNLNSGSVANMQTSEQEAIYANLTHPSSLLNCITFDPSGMKIFYFLWIVKKIMREFCFLQS